MATLITGAAGFIGSHVAARLIAEGHSPVLLDSFSDYYSSDLKRARVEAFDLHVQSVDLSDYQATMDLLRRHPEITDVIHLAAQPGVRVTSESTLRYVSDNLGGFGNLLLAAAEAGVETLTYASSSSVYGNSDSETFHEELPGLRPISLYGATKLANEVVAHAFSAQTGMRLRGLRYFTVYGPWGRPDMAYFRLIVSALTGTSFTVLGSTSVPRDLTFVDDAVEATLLCHRDLYSRAAAFSDVVNVGGGYPRSLREVIDAVKELTGRDIVLRQGERHDADVQKTHASAERLVSMVGFHPAHPLRLGLARVVEWATARVSQADLMKWVESVR